MKLSANWLPILIILLLLGYGTAQELPTAKPTAGASPEMTLSLIVTNNEERAVDVLKQEDVAVREGGVAQQILSVSADNRPIDYAIVIDNSGSFKFLLEPAITVAKYFVENNRSQDETFVERFISSEKIETVQEFTSDKTLINDAFDTLYVEEGQSAVIDAIYLAVQHVAKHRKSNDRRRAVVVLSDGEDRASYYTSDKLIDLLRATDVQLFIVGIVAQLKTGGVRNVRDEAKNLLGQLARESGGRVFFPKDFEGLRTAAKEIAHDLHQQFLVRYQPASISAKNDFRHVEVIVREAPGENKLTVHTRTGYYLTPPEFDDKGNKKKIKQPKASG